ncbi:CBS domain-containing protein [Streptomyces klenkii]
MLHHVACLLVEHALTSVPVVDREGERVVGVITLRTCCTPAGTGSPRNTTANGSSPGGGPATAPAPDRGTAR